MSAHIDDVTRRAMTDPAEYERYCATSAERNQAELEAQRAAQARQAPAYVPGRRTEETALEPVETLARQIQASEQVTYAQAYARALEIEPQAYEAAQAGAAVRHFSDNTNPSAWDGSSTPGGIARLGQEQALLDAINAALEPLQRQYPRLPRDILMGALFGQNKALRQRCAARCGVSG